MEERIKHRGNAFRSLIVEKKNLFKYYQSFKKKPPIFNLKPLIFYFNHL